MSDLQAERNPFEVLADEFASRVRSGEHPLISEYANRFPEHAEEINELFPSILMMERLKRRDDTSRRREQRYRKLGQFQHIGDYQLVRQVGRGGMGVVFEAVQKSLGRRVALKVLTDSAMASPKQVQRFEREARAAAALHHTNIVPVFGVGHEDDLHFYVMQYIQGTGLDEILAALRVLAQEQLEASAEPDASHAGSAIELARALRSNSFIGPPTMNSGSMDLGEHHETRAEQFDDSTVGDETVSSDGSGLRSSMQPPAPPAAVSEFLTGGGGTPQRLFGPQYYKAVARLTLQVAKALKYAHGQGVLHRDIKPGNLLLDPQGTVWVTDFGLAKLSENKDLTNSGDIVGTLRYMAPEQFEGQFDARGDVYSLGLTLYELLTLRPACDDTAIRKILDQRVQDRVAKPRSLNPAVPRDLETVVLKMISADPQDRYQTAAELADDLVRYLEDRPIEARRFTPVERFVRWSRRNPALAASSSAAVALLLLITVMSSFAYVHEKGQKQAISQANELAEGNLRLALRAFDDIVNNLGSRGVSQTFDLEFESSEAEEETPAYTSVATPADAELLGKLLAFFDEFAQQNSANLQAETAKAYHRMGDIQNRLGDEQAAQAAYRQAITLYEKLELTEVDKVANLVAWAETLNDLAAIEKRNWRTRRQGLRHNLAALNLLARQSAEMRQLPRIRFALAQTYLSSIKNLGPPPRSGGNRSRQSGAGGKRGGSGRLRVESNARPETLDRRAMVRQALSLLRDLLAEQPQNTAYRFALANALGSHVYLNRRSKTEAVVEAYEESLAILEQLVVEVPSQPRYRFELAQRLSYSFSVSDCPLVAQRQQHAVQLADELVREFPNTTPYEYLLTRCHMNSAEYHRRTEAWDAALANYRAAIEVQQNRATSSGRVNYYLVSLQRKLGETLREQGDLPQSREILAQTIQDLESITRPPDGWLRRHLSHLYDELAQTLEAAGETEGAEHWRQKREQLNSRRERSSRQRSRQR